MLCLDFRTPPSLPSDGFGRRPVWLQLSCPRLTGTASQPNLHTCWGSKNRMMHQEKLVAEVSFELDDLTHFKFNEEFGTRKRLHHVIWIISYDSCTCRTRADISWAPEVRLCYIAVPAKRGQLSWSLKGLQPKPKLLLGTRGIKDTCRIPKRWCTHAQVKPNIDQEHLEVTAPSRLQNSSWVCDANERGQRPGDSTSFFCGTNGWKCTPAA